MTRAPARSIAFGLVLATLVACSDPPAENRRVAKSDAEAAPSIRSRPRHRAPTRPRWFVLNEGLTRRDRHRIRQAVSDLKRLGFWKRLTDHLWQVRISTRPGEARIPQDGHLADAIYTFQQGRGSNLEPVCDIFFYSRAMTLDAERQAAAEAAGALEEPAPSLRQFWAVVLAHELAHCTGKGQKGEKHSTRWEERVLEALGADRLGG